LGVTKLIYLLICGYIINYNYKKGASAKISTKMKPQLLLVVVLLCLVGMVPSAKPPKKNIEIWIRPKPYPDRPPPPY